MGTCASEEIRHLGCLRRLPNRTAFTYFDFCAKQSKPADNNLFMVVTFQIQDICLHKKNEAVPDSWLIKGEDNYEVAFSGDTEREPLSCKTTGSQ